jgi:methionine synthase II (cobalamin-independent)
VTNSRFGIGTTTPNYPLEVNGNVGGISIFASNNIVAFSDRRIKNNIKIIENAVTKIKQINGITYTRTDDKINPEVRYAGVIAQEIEAILPEAVHTNPETGMKSVAYGNLSALFIEAIKELNQKIEDLQNQLNNK